MPTGTEPTAIAEVAEAAADAGTFTTLPAMYPAAVRGAIPLEPQHETGPAIRSTTIPVAQLPAGGPALDLIYPFLVTRLRLVIPDAGDIVGIAWGRHADAADIDDAAMGAEYPTYLHTAPTRLISLINLGAGALSGDLVVIAIHDPAP